jgi:glycosyltransferase involved in cell wall biosynthesis
VRAFDIGAAFIPDKPQYRNQPPLKTVEYLATGLPVAATDTPGNRRFVTHDENAEVAAPNVDAYADSLVELATDEEYRNRLSERARESVLEYDYERIVTDRLIPLYERLQTS